jgi:hypothetical protein
MEHGIHPVKSIVTYLFVAYILLAATTAHADEGQISIVVGEGSSLTSITPKDVRRVYLGASLILEGHEVKPILNRTDKLTLEVFLQKVMFMSVDAYERQLIARAFRGGSSPKSYYVLGDLLAALQNDKAAITFMPYETAINTPGIRIVGSP